MDFITFLSNLSWPIVAQIILIDLLLGGDNAVVIALACRNLAPKHRWQGILWGTAGAIVLRIVLVTFAVTLLKIPTLKIVGGLLLLWIGVKLMKPESDDSHDDIKASSNLWEAVRTIIVADLVMSLDNVVAIAGAAQHAPGEQQIYYVVFGLLVSIPIIVFGSQLVMKIMDKFPVVITLGAGLLGFIAGGLIVDDPLVENRFGAVSHSVSLIAGAIGAVAVMAIGQWLIVRHRRSRLKQSD